MSQRACPQCTGGRGCPTCHGTCFVWDVDKAIADVLGYEYARGRRAAIAECVAALEAQMDHEALLSRGALLRAIEIVKGRLDHE